MVKALNSGKSPLTVCWGLGHNEDEDSQILESRVCCKRACFIMDEVFLWRV